jgi:hypothetical protein
MRMRSWWLALGIVAAALVVTGTAMSKNGKGGPYAVATTDKGSCDQAWAHDTLRRTYLVKKLHAGYRVERRDRGTFVTIGSQSPGACEPGRHGTTVGAGHRGTVKGLLVGVVTGGVYDKNAFCSGDACGSTDVWLRTHFGPGARFTCLQNSRDCRFSFEYRASGKALRFSRWSDRGTGSGNRLSERCSGDIAER